MARKKSNPVGDAAAVLFGIVVFAILFAAPFFYIYQLLQPAEEPSQDPADYDLSHEERNELLAAKKQVNELGQQHQRHLDQGLPIAQSGDFDKRSNAGKFANTVKENLDEQSNIFARLSNAPLDRLSTAINAVKMQKSAKYAIWILAGHFVYIFFPYKSDMSWINNYFASSFFSAVAFACIWCVFSAWYWVSYTQVRDALNASVNAD